MENPINLIGEILGGINNRRTQDVIRLRFGLDDGQPKTLQEIGEKYNITRERVRQIENNGLGSLASAAVKERIKPIQETISDYLKDYGELRRESSLYNDMVCVCYPASQIEQLTQKNRSELDRCRSSLNFILTLADPFNRIGETEDFYPVWTISKSAIKTAARTLDSAVKQLNIKKQVLKDREILEILKKKLPGVSDKALLSYIDASKPIEQNAFGDFGLADWPEISPRGVRDKAYLVFKREGRPLHFSEVTDLINQLLPTNKTAYIQTVHNELIKDPRFILIGRGIYALKEWGYEPGTVVEIISQLLKEKGPMTKEEIIKNVLAKRLIKDNTILINLQNRKYFKKLDDGRFAIV